MTHSIDPDVEKQVTEGLDFILTHLKNPTQWPRTISTKASEGRQITVYSKQEALLYYKDSNYLDCRISAYNAKAEQQTIALLMIDLDLSNFKSNNKDSTNTLNLAKKKTLAKIQDTFDLSKNFESATVIWSGNGYHLYIPAESQNAILEQMSEFSRYKEPSKLFLRFAECYLSNGKADSEHYHTVSFKNCLLRIPGSYNSKNMSQVSIVQKWNGASKVALHLLYDKFLAYLIDQGSKVVKHHNNKTLTILSENAKSAYIARKNPRLLLRKKQSIDWIEQLLQTPLSEHRKYCIWRILAPYFINVKHLSFDSSYDKIYQWLDMCNELRALDFDPGTKINDSLNTAINAGYLPISLDNPLKEPRTLKTDNRELYNIIKTNYSILQ
jgi:Primase X